jgi:hypothetical protein
MRIPNIYTSDDVQVIDAKKDAFIKVVAVFSDVVEMVATHIKQVRCLNGSYLLIYEDGDITEIPSGKALYITFSTQTIESE